VGLGNLVRWKRWDLLVDALAALPSEMRDRLECTVWGPTPPDADAPRFEAELREGLRRHSLESCLRFPGTTGGALEILASADAFVLPSTQEPCSVALMEALATGIPAFVSAALSRRSRPAPVTCTSLRTVPSNSDAGSFGPTAGMTNAGTLRIKSGSSAVSGAW
jgi:glycosyltransferase involved in cell wall biosynthesis